MALDPTPDWQRQVMYFLLPDRFSDEQDRPRWDREHDPHPLPAEALTKTWYWNLWAISGRNRFQGGTIRGITRRLPYLAELGVTTLWLGPVWKQRAAGVDANTNGDSTDDPIAYVAEADRTRPLTPQALVGLQRPRDDPHGYAIQDFCAVDPRFGTKKDLRKLVEAAHDAGMYVIFDVMFNHSAENFTYDVADNPMRPPFVLFDQNDDKFGDPGSLLRYPFGSWLDVDNRPLPRGVAPRDRDEGVWPKTLQSKGCYTRAGKGDYGDGRDEDEGQFRVSDYRNRDFYYPPKPGPSRVLDAMLTIWCDWIDETNCDGFRIDTFKHVPRWVAEKATVKLREHAAVKHGKKDFLVFGEAAGGDYWEASYMAIKDVRLLELGSRRNALRALARGDAGQAAQALTPPQSVDGVPLPSARLVMTIDDHDGLWADRKTRLAADGEHCVLPAVTYLLFGPSIPCLYYGTEQALSGPVGAGNLLDSFGMNSGGQGGDRYLREAMFGPANPRKAGRAGRPGKGVAIDDPDLFDKDLPGFGPGGSCGVEAFDQESPWYRGIAALARARREYPVLATGAITRLTRGRLGGGFGADLSNTVVAWLRHDRASEAWAVVAVDLRGSDQPTRTVDVALPAVLGTPAAARRRVALVRGQAPDTTAPKARFVRRPQTGEVYLSLHDLTPGEIRLYVSP